MLQFQMVENLVRQELKLWHRMNSISPHINDRTIIKKIKKTKQ